MARLMIVPRADWEVLKNYLDADILVPEEAMDELTSQEQDAVRAVADGEFDIEYDFGGDADHWIDVIHCSESYAMTSIMEQRDTEEEDEV